jgi:subtilase family serine protease
MPSAASAGVQAHTHLQMLAAKFTGTPSNIGPPFPGLFYETPASIACIYGLAPQQPPAAGCNPNSVDANPNGGGGAIAIVDAYDNPNAVDDLQTFNLQFGVTPINPASFMVVYAPHGGAAPGSCDGAAVKPPPAAGTGWDIEASLDVQWAHAMAPGAKLYLVEAQSNLSVDLYCAVSTAGKILTTPPFKGGEISMSWGGGEFPGETAVDHVFTTSGVVYFASTGDAPSTQYPSVSPNVVAVGGTTLSRDPVKGNFIFENTWQSTGGGISLFESRPTYQKGIAALVGDHRGVPDIAADANPFTGVWVFNSSLFGVGEWFILGGTSVASPVWAGITNAAGSFSASSTAQLTMLYGDPASDFNDITVGVCGPYMGYAAAAGWDVCSGLGSPNTYSGK